MDLAIRISSVADFLARIVCARAFVGLKFL